MKDFTFISTRETLKDTLAHVTPSFQTMANILPVNILHQLSAADRAYCADTFVFKNQMTFEVELEEPPRSIEQLMEEVVRELLGRIRKPYVQCLGQQYKDFTLKMKSLNFGRTIIESTPAFRSLFALMPHNQFYRIMLNYIIIVPYKGEYIQVAGRMLNEKYNMKAVGGSRRSPAVAEELPSVVTAQSSQGSTFIGSKEPSEIINAPIEAKNNPNSPIPALNTKNVATSQTGHSSQPNLNAKSKPKHSQNLKGSYNDSANNIQPSSKNKPQMTKSYSYSSEQINRFQIFYCSPMNKAPGLFCKNIFFDKGQKISPYIHESHHLIKKCLDEHFKGKMGISERHLSALYPILMDYFANIRQIFHLRTYRGKMTSKFNLLLSRYCRLDAKYQSLKSDVLDYINGRPHRPVDELFNDLYAQSSNYDGVKGLIDQILRLTVPEILLGKQNLKILRNMMENFISMKRFENYKIQDFLGRLDVFELSWLECKYNKKYHRSIIIRRRKFLALVVSFVVNELVVPILKFNFYVTEKHKEANKIFYYRKPVWTLISKVALKRFSEENLEQVEEQLVLKMKKNLLTMYPEGKLRILPKKGTFRPIITFNRKVQFLSEVNSKIKMKATLNQYLSDTQLVLRNLKNILGDKFGYCIFDNRQIMRKYDAFVQKWRSSGCPPLKYFTLDIHKCYDSIDTSRLLKFIEETNYIDEQYLVVKYNRLYRNKKPLFGKNAFTGYFNFKERVTAIPMKDDLMEIHEQHKIPAINLFPAKQRMITKQAIINKLRRICEGSIVSYRKNYWLQKLGIPQGLNVSGVLCSLYFACLQQQFVKVKEGLLMRLTDDYFYIGPEREAVKVLDSLLHCADKNNFRFSEDKISKNFEHHILKKVNDAKEIVWIGKRINVETLQMWPNFEMSERISYAMNVNLNRRSIKSFLKNKLKSLLTNHFASYFKPKLFPYAHTAGNVRLYMKISLEKYYPFLQELIKFNIDNQQQLLLKVFKSCVHEFLLFACMLADAINDRILYGRLYAEVADQIASFFRRKASHPEFHSLRKIFEADAKRFSKLYFESMMTQ